MTKRNGSRAITDPHGRGRLRYSENHWRLFDKGHGPYRYMLVNEDTGVTDYPVRHANGKITYDRPEAIPAYVRVGVNRELGAATLSQGVWSKGARCACPPKRASKGRRATYAEQARINAAYTGRIHPAWADMKKVGAKAAYLNRHADDFKVHDKRALTEAGNSEPFVWIVRDGGTHLFFPGRPSPSRGDSSNDPSSLIGMFGPGGKSFRGGAVFSEEAIDFYGWTGRIFKRFGGKTLAARRSNAVAFAKFYEREQSGPSGPRSI